MLLEFFRFFSSSFYIRDQFFLIFSFLILFVFAHRRPAGGEIILQMNYQPVSAYDKTIQGWFRRWKCETGKTEQHLSRVADQPPPTHEDQ